VLARRNDEPIAAYGNRNLDHDAHDANRFDRNLGLRRPQDRLARTPWNGRLPEFLAGANRRGRDDVAAPRPEDIPPGESAELSEGPIPLPFRQPATGNVVMAFVRDLARQARRKEDRMTQDISFATARSPRRTARVRTDAPDRDGHAGYPSSRARCRDAGLMPGCGQENMRCRVFTAGGDS
jgi:hypothetical protein